MEKSIFRTILFYASIQLAFISISSVAAKVPLDSLFIYACSSIILHFALYWFLIKLKVNFYNQSTNTPLTKINLANRITLLRISCLPTIAFLLRHNEVAEIKTILPVLLGLVFLTDSFDGQIARRKKQITRMGAMLDSTSDYILLGVISIVYYRHNIVPHWFFYVIILRLFLQGAGMLIFIMLKKPLEIKSTWGGKITIATTMSLYVIELIRLYLPANFDIVFRIVEYASGAIVLLLCFEKGLIFLKQGLKKKADSKDRTYSPEQY